MLVMKLIAVLNDRSGLIPLNPCGFSGSRSWKRRIRYSTTKLAMLKASIESV